MKSTEFKLIPLTGERGKGKHAIVDAKQYERLSAWSWYLHPRGYAHANVTIERGVKRSLPMHRLLIAIERDQVTDHINRNRLDNRLSNLRAVSVQENRWNSEQTERGAPRPGPGGIGERAAADPSDFTQIVRVGRGELSRRYALPRYCYIWLDKRSGLYVGRLEKGESRAYVPSSPSASAVAESLRKLYRLRGFPLEK